MVNIDSTTIQGCTEIKGVHNLLFGKMINKFRKLNNLLISQSNTDLFFFCLARNMSNYNVVNNSKLS